MSLISTVSGTEFLNPYVPQSCFKILTFSCRTCMTGCPYFPLSAGLHECRFFLLLDHLVILSGSRATSAVTVSDDSGFKSFPMTLQNSICCLFQHFKYPTRWKEYFTPNNYDCTVLLANMAFKKNHKHSVFPRSLSERSTIMWTPTLNNIQISLGLNIVGQI